MIKTLPATFLFRQKAASNEKVSITTGYYLAFIALGLTKAVLGPTLPGLAEQTGVGISAISILFAASAIGGLLWDENQNSGE